MVQLVVDIGLVVDLSLQVRPRLILEIGFAVLGIGTEGRERVDQPSVGGHEQPRFVIDQQQSTERDPLLDDAGRPLTAGQVGSSAETSDRMSRNLPLASRGISST